MNHMNINKLEKTLRKVPEKCLRMSSYLKKYNLYSRNKSLLVCFMDSEIFAIHYTLTHRIAYIKICYKEVGVLRFSDSVNQ